MNNFFKNYTLSEALEDITGVVLLFGGIILLPYAIALVKAIL